MKKSKIMKNKFFALAVLMLIIVFSSCKNTGNGELTGVNRKAKYNPVDPYGMVYIPMGSYTIGVGDEDPMGYNNTSPRTVSVSAFYMDQTEITNSEYRQFVNWVRDSIAMTILGESYPETYLIEQHPKTGEIYDPPIINQKAKIDWKDPEVQEALEELFIPEHERYARKKEIDARKLYYDYYWIDFNAAAQKDLTDPDNDPVDGSFATRPQGRRDRSVFVKKERINVYPDTLCWISDYAYSYNEPMAKFYFSHQAYDNYPVVGVNWKQARAFCAWRTELKNSFIESEGKGVINEYRLPTEIEWERAARGGYEGNPYPWGGPYTFNEKGCYLANFKPQRGNYAADGGLTTLIVGHFPPNDFNLYDMAGNVAEWTIDAFDESSYNFGWDMNLSYTYNAKDTDPPALKRKVVRGGSWKDVYNNIQVSNRSYEYQDTATSYVGFRCVQSFLGRQKGDSSKASAIY
ncbi:SUMF1/EgtB/PvdO family nonheme iron enzyme [Bacteroidales bacterium OttesenSCG-928-K03]|nr:SUMF1/EgtB/PvdO family nonheme iron enzyme [Bacteroidales bacterium OttesenSCG-928-K03]